MTYTKRRIKKYCQEERSFILNQLNSSGLTMTVFSKQTGIPNSTLATWRNRAKVSKESNSFSFKKATVAKTSSFIKTQQSPDMCHSDLELHIGHDVILIFRKGFSKRDLQMAVTALHEVL